MNRTDPQPAGTPEQRHRLAALVSKQFRILATMTLMLDADQATPDRERLAREVYHGLDGIRRKLAATYWLPDHEELQVVHDCMEELLDTAREIMG